MDIIQKQHGDTPEYILGKKKKSGGKAMWNVKRESGP